MKANTFAAAVMMAAMATAAPLTLTKRAGTSYNGGDTASDITNKVCAPVTFLFARGSTESGTMGSSVGPALAKQLISSLGAENVAVQGVDYPATIESNASLGSEGGPEMATLGKQAISQCPNTKLVLSGYSQGATVTHYAVASAGLSASDVAAVVLYGDPEDGSAVGSVPAAKLKEFCASGDGVCESHGFDITAAHLSYTTNGDIAQGSTFIVNAVGSLNGASSSNASAPAASASAVAATPAASSAAASPFGGLGGSSTGSGLGSLSSSFPGLGGGSTGTSGGLGSLESSFPSLGGSGESSGLGGLTGSSTGSSLGGLSSGFPSLGGGESSGLGGLTGSSTGSSLGGLSSGLPSLGGSSSEGGLSGLGGLLGGGESGSSNPLGSLTGGEGSTGTASGLGALSSLGSLGGGSGSF